MKVKQMDMEYMFIMMEVVNMKVIGKIIYNMVKVKKHIKMVHIMKEVM